MAPSRNFLRNVKYAVRARMKMLEVYLELYPGGLEPDRVEELEDLRAALIALDDPSVVAKMENSYATS